MCARASKCVFVDVGAPDQVEDEECDGRDGRSQQQEHSETADRYYPFPVAGPPTSWLRLRRAGPRRCCRWTGGADSHRGLRKEFEARGSKQEFRIKTPHPESENMNAERRTQNEELRKSAWRLSSFFILRSKFI